MSERTNLYFPLWVDGGLSPTLHAGARALRDYLAPRFAFEEIPVDADCSPSKARGIVGYETIIRHLARARGILAELRPERLFTIGGGCGIEVAIVGHMLERYPDLKLLWFDAHGDLNSPASSPSAYFHGMPLRFLLEPDLEEGISPGGAALDPAALRLVGCRDLDSPEAAYIEERSIMILSGVDAASAAKGWEDSPLYVHVDLDVLDPRDYLNVKCPAPGGLRIGELARSIGALLSSRRMVGLSLVENTATDARTLARLEPVFEVARTL
ncbi:MAG: arginase family protein [Rectinemataceae bacterium]